MNVLGKIKSKKAKLNDQKQSQSSTQNIIKTQSLQKIQVEKSNDNFSQINQQQLNEVKQKQLAMNSRNKQPQSSFFKSSLLTKPKQKQFFESESSNRSSFMFSKKVPKKQGIYFEQKREPRAISQQSANQQFDLELIITSKQKPLNPPPKTTSQNLQQIQKQLISQNQDVICFVIKKYYLYGDVYLFDGEMESIKKKFVQCLKDGKNVKIYHKIKVKLSTNYQTINNPQSIARIYLTQLEFISENQAIFIPQFILRIVQKSKRISRG